MLRGGKNRFTPTEYLAMEEVSDHKSKFYAGEIFAVTGGTADHSPVAVNLTAELRQALAARSCRVFNSDMRLQATCACTSRKAAYTPIPT